MLLKDHPSIHYTKSYNLMCFAVKVNYSKKLEPDHEGRKGCKISKSKKSAHGFTYLKLICNLFKFYIIK